MHSSVRPRPKSHADEKLSRAKCWPGAAANQEAPLAAQSRTSLPSSDTYGIKYSQIFIKHSRLLPLMNSYNALRSKLNIWIHFKKGNSMILIHNYPNIVLKPQIQVIILPIHAENELPVWRVLQQEPVESLISNRTKRRSSQTIQYINFLTKSHLVPFIDFLFLL